MIPSRVKALAAMAGLLLAAALSLNLYIKGSVIVRDTGNSIDHIALRSGERTIAGKRAFGIHWLMGGLEGETIAKCRTGAEINFGYFASIYHIWQSVRPADCASPARRRRP